MADGPVCVMISGYGRTRREKTKRVRPARVDLAKIEQLCEQAGLPLKQKGQ